MKVNKWTLGLAAVGLVSLPSVMQAEEKASTMMTALSATTISGYVNTSMEWNPGTGNANPPGFAFNKGKQDGFNLDVVKLTIERPLDEAQWAAGYRVDLLFGPDANSLATSSSGIATSDFAIKQAYVAVRAPIGNGLDFKLGVWDTIIGYETFDAGSNPNYTRSYGYTMEPTTHTGLLATYHVNNMIDLAAGIANSFGPTINQRANPPKAESYKTYMASVSFTAPESFGFAKGATLYGCIINGFNSAAIGGGQTAQQSYYIGSTVPTPITGLKLGASYDYAGVSHNNNATLGGLGVTAAPTVATWQDSAAGYLSFQASEKLSLHSRVEYFWQSKANVNLLSATALPSKVLAFTETIQYDLWKNVLSRLEVRWDHAADGTTPYAGTPADVNGAGGPVFAAGSKKNSVLVAANLIYKF